MLDNVTTSLHEVQRPLLTPDEVMRLPSPVKDGDGNILEAGDMLIFVAGHSPIYGKQILYFIDPVFSARARIPAPACSDHLCNREDETVGQEPCKAAETASTPATSFASNQAVHTSEFVSHQIAADASGMLAPPLGGSLPYEHLQEIMEHEEILEMPPRVDSSATPDLSPANGSAYEPFMEAIAASARIDEHTPRFDQSFLCDDPEQAQTSLLQSTMPHKKANSVSPAVECLQAPSSQSKHDFRP